MSESAKPEHVSAIKRVSGIARKTAKVFLVLAGIGLLINFVTVQIPKLMSQINDAAPAISRDFLLWLATDKTVSQINALASDWSGLLTILGIVLAVVFYILSLEDRSKTIKGRKG
jgi:hypothetical protein